MNGGEPDSFGGRVIRLDVGSVFGHEGLAKFCFCFVCHGVILTDIFGLSRAFMKANGANL
jgi:hypothetical protein